MRNHLSFLYAVNQQFTHEREIKLRDFYSFRKMIAAALSNILPLYYKCTAVKILTISCYNYFVIDQFRSVVRGLAKRRSHYFFVKNQLRELNIIWQGMAIVEVDCIRYFRHFSTLISTVVKTCYFIGVWVLEL